MPEAGIDFLRRKELMTYEELLRFARIMAGLGVKKIRITGGEPFVRKDLDRFIEELYEVTGCELHVTTNATVLGPYIHKLHSIGIRSVNVSLDTLDRNRFDRITRRDMFEKVWLNLMALMETPVKVKLNMVVQTGINEHEIIPMSELTKKFAIEVRFIEEMPFNGSGRKPDAHMNFDRIHQLLRATYTDLSPTTDIRNSSAVHYYSDKLRGNLAIIPAFSRSLCGSCNRIRITPTGMLRTCLYDPGTFNVRDMMRSGCTDNELRLAITEAAKSKAKDGFVAERRAQRQGFFESMATIGG
jgi:cyclic pyranopterin phosphate synthase